jgi:hypothetical protein
LEITCTCAILPFQQNRYRYRYLVPNRQNFDCWIDGHRTVLAAFKPQLFQLCSASIAHALTAESLVLNRQDYHSWPSAFVPDQTCSIILHLRCLYCACVASTTPKQSLLRLRCLYYACAASIAHALSTYLIESLVLSKPDYHSWSSASVPDQTCWRSQSPWAWPCPTSRRTPHSPASGPCNWNWAIENELLLSHVILIIKDKHK